MHLAPKLLGAGPSLVGDLGISTIADALSPVDRRRHPAWAGTCSSGCARPGTLGASSTRTEGVEVFTGIVEEVGTLVVREDQSGRRAVLQIRADRVLEDVALGDSIAVNGVCLTVTAVDRRRLEHRRHGRDAEPQQPGRGDRRRAGQPRARGHPAHPPRRAHDAGPRRRRRHGRRPHARRALGGRADRPAGRAWPATSSRRARSPSTASRSPSAPSAPPTTPSPGSRSASSPPPSARPRSVRAPRGSPSTWRST